MDILSLERIWNHTPVVESDNLSRYCPIDAITFMGMESDYINESSKFHLHVFYRMDSENQWYIDMYIWDCMLYPDICRRIIIQNGFILAEEDENLFMEYTKRPESEGMYDKKEFDLIRKHFSHAEDNRFRRCDYPSVELQAIYFSGHKGVREILCKAGLDFISYHLERIPEFNLIGLTPVSIVGYGVTNKFLRIVNTPEMVGCLFDEKQLQRCLTVYKAYSGYVEKDFYERNHMYARCQNDLRKMLRNRTGNIISVQLSRMNCSNQCIERYIVKTVMEEIHGAEKYEIYILPNYDKNIFTIEILHGLI